jgi:hypothetical protein
VIEGAAHMLSWQELTQRLRQYSHTLIRFIKNRRRENVVPFALAALFFLLGLSLPSWLPNELQQLINAWRGNLIIQLVLYGVGIIFFIIGSYRAWKLLNIPDLPPVKNMPSAVKGAYAFTPADGELFRKLGREEELRKLLGFIEDDQVGIVVLRGAYGAGKTSLLRAGLTNILSGKEFKYHYWEAVPSVSGKGLLRAIQESWNSNGSGETISTLHSAPSTDLNSFDELVNPSPPLREVKHVIVLDQFEQLGSNTNNQVIRLLKKLIRETKPPHRITWIIAFRREFHADWADLVQTEQELGFHPPEFSLRLFTAEQAHDVISQLINEAGLLVEQKVIDNLIESATVDNQVSPVDIGIGLLVLSELYEQQAGKTITKDVYLFAGGAEGLLTKYISRCLDMFPDEDRKTILNALLALRDPETNQRIAEGKTSDQLLKETGAKSHRLKIQLERLSKKDMRLLEHVDLAEGDNALYRLPHERLISALNRLAGTELRELEEANRQLENKFSIWKKKKDLSYLLKGRDFSLVKNVEPLLQLNLQSLNITWDRSQRKLLKEIPKTITDLSF